MNKKLIRFRKDTGKWEINFTNPHIKGQRIRKSWSDNKKETQQEAQRLYAELYATKRSTEYYSDTSMSEVIESYKQDRGTNIGYLDWVNKILGDKDIKEISRSNQYQQLLINDCNENQNSNSGINRKLDTFRALMNYARDELGLIDSYKKIRKLKIEKFFEGTYLTFQDIRSFQEAMVGEYEYMRDPFDFSILSGLRKSNIVNLKKSHIQDTIHGRRLYFSAEQMKAKRPHALPLTPHMEKIIKRNWHEDSEYIFKGYKGNPNGLGDFKKAWITLRNITGIECRWHDLRHACATNHANNGVSLFELMDIMAWSSIQMARKYVHGSQSNLFNRMMMSHAEFDTDLARQTNKNSSTIHNG